MKKTWNWDRDGQQYFVEERCHKCDRILDEREEGLCVYCYSQDILDDLEDDDEDH